MQETTPETIKAIEIAIAIETGGLAFYSQAAKQTDDPKGKKMFESLAKDEATHLQLFKDARQALLDKNNWLTPEQIKQISPERRIPVFPEITESKQIQVPQRMLDALQRGIQAEQDSIDFYTEQMQKVDDPNAQAMYAYLIEQEKGHRTILQGEYDYLTQTGFWFDIREFNLESAG